MDMKNNGSAYKRIKGFTLVELLVVMAIIAILAGISSLAVQGFIRNSRRESANDNARLLFTGFQNIVTQCEIKQDNSLISPSFTNDATLTNITISMKIYDGNIQTYEIKATTTATATLSSDYTGDSIKYSDATPGSNKSKLPNEVMGIIDNTFEGEVKVYIDYANFEVKSVVYKPMLESNRNTTINDFTDGALIPMTGTGMTYQNGTKQDDAYKNHPLYGVYPFLDNVT